ncbi:hypothetical protein HMPREF9709_01460 [Helcococcus kunzii ATCC 51366]|uniref:Uncharacterized protein n=1 Tax=Helcococcus kunzii ATCC 51366 TaxID=883114 RepID=H3NQ49_9FIRM|nr:hypothetical protein [Helcococcus kunzii]EHR32529.1 hypothetical protein HMPREF9709_01460 [Helcococcus kunzii ATCC 51366]MCT1796360.1 hypothetical protein [Helcococcus kunzii]MCT1989410.1 hypothetical protein [Helcococcus kunzii]
MKVLGDVDFGFGGFGVGFGGGDFGVERFGIGRMVLMQFWDMKIRGIESLS